MQQKNLTSSAAPIRPHPARRRNVYGEKGRNPYDGLRLWSALTHCVGAGLALAGTVVLLVFAALGGCSAWHIVSFAIFGGSMVLLYTMSTLYHSVKISIRGRIVLRKCDHMSIYLLIAGTYTPLCLVALRNSGVTGWVVFGIIWRLAVAGIILTAFWIGAPRALTLGIYLGMGWAAVFALVPLYHVFPASGFFWLIGGGVFYTVGGILYACKWPGRNNKHFGCHEIFHVFIMLGSLFHFFMMLFVIAKL
ncbi:MAG: hemolysin III family protein [Oscillospiraceae bacterium]|nr:hemolysin III family protein [Oscillospiraceae bacterium]